MRFLLLLALFTLGCNTEQGSQTVKKLDRSTLAFRHSEDVPAFTRAAANHELGNTNTVLYFSTRSFEVPIGTTFTMIGHDLSAAADEVMLKSGPHSGEIVWLLPGSPYSEAQ